MTTFKHGQVVKLKDSVNNHVCPEGRDDNETAVVFTTYGDANSSVMTVEDLRGCRYWNEDDLELVE
jgi:hypothetical protein